MNRSFAPHRAGGFSLVVTLIIVSMLAVVAIGFLASMSNERATADAYGNKTRAEQAAQSGADSAIAILRQAFKDFPDSATVWETHSLNKDGTAAVDSDHPVAAVNEGTTLYVRAMPDSSSATDPLPDPAADNSPSHTVSATDGSDARSMFVLPLISGARYLQKNQLSTWTNPGAKPSINGALKGFPDQYVDLNVRRAKDDTQGWLGSPLRPSPANGKGLPPRTVRVPWVNITQADAPAGTTAPVVARYAFWVEDESFRANINYTGLGDAPFQPSRNRLDNSGGSKTTVRLDPEVVDLFGSLRALFDPSVALPLSLSLARTRLTYPGAMFSEGLGYTHAPGLGVAQADQLRFLTTTTSGGLNLSRHGTQRLNLNPLVYPQTDADGVPIKYTDQEQIDAIVKTIQFHAPNFGQRFYRNVANAKDPNAASPSVLNDLFVQNSDPSHQLMYLYKIGTNIKDYMDPDVMPTFVDGVKDSSTSKYVGKVHIGPYFSNQTPPAIIYPNPNADNGNVIWAQGKDSAPYLDECAVRFTGGVNSTSNRYNLRFDYYVEVWNPTNKDVQTTDQPNSTGIQNLKVRIVNQPYWEAATINTTPIAYARLPVDGTGPSPSDESDVRRDFSLVVPPGTVFKAGKATVLTTDPRFGPPPDPDPSLPKLATAEGLKNFVYCKVEGSNLYTGSMPLGKTRLVMKGRQGSVYSSDYATEVALFSTNGFVDCSPGPMPIYSGNPNTLISIGNGSSSTNPAHTANKAYGGSLRANGGATNTPEPSVTGDPRSNNEQLVTNPAYPGSLPTVNQPRYYNFGQNSYTDPAPPAQPVYPGTLGLPNTDYTKPDNVGGNFTPWPDYYQFPGGAQPVMNASNALMNVANAEITSIGQLGDVYDPARAIGTNLSLARGGGRTLKIGQPDDLWDGDYRSASRSWAAWRLADFFGVNDAVLQPGLININGVARDNGAALRAALTGFKFQDNPPGGTGPGIEKQLLVSDTTTSTPPTQGLDTLIYQIKKRLAPDTGSVTTGTVGSTPANAANPDYAPYNTGQGPFWERGEFSELPAFGRTNVAASTPAASYTGADLVSGAVTNQTFDRGREEVFRRLSEIITTRGNVFTVYAMGQTISPKAPTSGQLLAVTSTQRLKVTFRLVPKAMLGAGSTNGTASTTAATAPDFHPASKTGTGGMQYPEKLTLDPATLSKRFAKPDHYDIEILSASKGGG